MQRYTVYFIWKLLYMFRVVPSPIIRSANNCIYSIWYLSDRYCYLPLSWKSWNYKQFSNFRINTGERLWGTIRDFILSYFLDNKLTNGESWTQNNYSNTFPTRCNVTQFIFLSGNCSTCFGWYHHPSSGAQTTVSTASGICHTGTAYLLL